MYALIASLISIASATTFMAIPFSQTVKEADHIVRGKIGNRYVDWGTTGQKAEGSKKLYTYFELKVDEVFKGNISNVKTLVMRQMGGEKDGVGMMIPGSAQFQVGEDVVVMLGPQLSDQTYDLIGLMTGKLQVVRDSSGQEVLKGPAVSGDFGSESHVESVGADGNDQKKPHENSVVTLEDLRKTVLQTGGKIPTKNQEIPKPSEQQGSEPAAPKEETISDSAKSEQSSEEDPWLTKLKSPLGIGLIALYLVIHFIRRSLGKSKKSSVKK